jgi:ferredoxin
VPYVASTSVSFVQDLEEKVKKAASIKGARFISVFTPCVPGWGYESALTVELGELVVESGLWKLFEIDNGEFKLNYRPRQRKPVKEYFKPQKRFKHLTDEEIEEIQKIIDEDWKKYGEVNMPKPTVDKGKCVSCGLCVNICGDVFKFGDDGKSEVIADADFEANKDCIEELVSGSSKCPVGAISWK